MARRVWRARKGRRRQRLRPRRGGLARGTRRVSGVRRRGTNQTLVYRPTRRGDILPSELVTTHEYISRIVFAANAITRVGQYFSIKASSLYLPLSANGFAGTSYLPTAAAAGSGAFDTPFANTNQAQGYTTLSGVYAAFQVLSSTIAVTPTFATGTDTLKLFVSPYVSLSNNSNAQPALTEYAQEDQRYMKSMLASGYQGPKTLRNSMASHVMLGYPDMKSFIADFTGTGWTVYNPNTIPYNAWQWQLFYTMTDGNSSNAIITLDIRVKYRVRWSEFVAMV